MARRSKARSGYHYCHQQAPPVSRRDAHPIVDLVGRRVVIGILTLFVVSLVVFLATQVLPGNAAYAMLGRRRTRPGCARPSGSCT